MSSINLSVLTPSGSVFEGEASYLLAPSSNGPIGIMPGHTTLIAPLAKKGVLKIVKANKEEIFFATSFGALEIKKEKTVILTEIAIKTESEEEAKKILNESERFN